jgi:hypothetical protein
MPIERCDLGHEETKDERPDSASATNLKRYDGICTYYAIWWEGKTVLKKVGRKFWQKP